jgi:serine/threonine protein kinase
MASSSGGTSDSGLAGSQGLLGQGIYNAVLPARYNGMPVAVKLIHPALLAAWARSLAETHGPAGTQDHPQELARELLVHEVEVLLRCPHPHVVTLLGGGLAGPQPFLVMERMACSLADVLHRDAASRMDTGRVLSDLAAPAALPLAPDPLSASLPAAAAADEGNAGSQVDPDGTGGGGGGYQADVGDSAGEQQLGAHRQALPLDAVLRIARDIASGLAFLHPIVVHRDLK